MRAGRYRLRIELQRNEGGVADFEPVEKWVTYASPWAEKQDPRGDEVVSALETQSRLSVVFGIRYRDGVSPAHRVKWTDRIFDIKAATNPDGRKKRLLLHCVEHRSDGD